MRRIYYNVITNNLLNYLPSRILIILNSLLIIPILTLNLGPKEISIYLIAIQILNLICTCSYDWTSKAVLRFYEKYNINNQLKEFLSTIFWLSVFLYGLILLLYFLLKDFVFQKYSVSNTIFLSTLILIIPCGIRQTLYQILRIKNEFKLYTISIIIYYTSFIFLFLALVKFNQTALSIIFAMNIAITFIDILIIKKITLNDIIEFSLNKSILKEILIYSFPLVFTNTGYWVIFHISKLIFQNLQEFQSTATVGIAWTLSNSIMQPLVTLFTFATFPIIFKKFELNKKIKRYLTKNIQLYIVLLLPAVFTFCFFPTEITKLVVPEQYGKVALLIPFFSLTVFLHEFLKISNIKYHLKNKTYIETGISFLTVIFTYKINIFLINRYSVFGAGIAMLLCEILLIIFNFFIKNEARYGIKYKPIFKTVFYTTIFSGIWFCAVKALGNNNEDNTVLIIKLITFILLTYLTLFHFKDRILS